jgi:CRP/FNR family transcriptional regulator, cyclic AMP receptor protein
MTPSDEIQPSQLQRVPLFAELSEEDLTRVAAATRRLRWDPGHVAVKEGEFAFDFYAIEDGAAEVQRGAQRLGELGPGDCFGELGVTRPESGRWSRRRTASVVVTAPTEALAIDGSEIRSLAGEIPELANALRAAAEAHRDS